VRIAEKSKNNENFESGLRAAALLAWIGRTETAKRLSRHPAFSERSLFPT
jgi:hypothetical protein